MILTFSIISFFVVILFQNETLIKLYPSKIWVHRTNNKVLLKKAIERFSGAEFDVVFKSDLNIYDVNHPPDSSINLSLFEYFESVKENKTFNYWIDFKNLSKENYINALKRLDFITEILEINKSNIIVESTNVKFLMFFMNKGYKVSYYLSSNLSKLKGKEIEEVIRSIKFYEGKTDYISFNAKEYKVCRTNFSNSKKLIWNLLNEEIKINNLYSLKRATTKFIEKLVILNDDKIEVVLIHF